MESFTTFTTLNNSIDIFEKYIPYNKKRIIYKKYVGGGKEYESVTRIMGK